MHASLIDRTSHAGDLPVAKDTMMTAPTQGCMGGVVKKHFHLTFHFTVNIDESKIPTEGIHAKTWYTRSSRDDEAWHETDDRQRRLLKAVLANNEVLNRWLRMTIASWFEQEEWKEALPPDDEWGDILAPAIATLSKDDRETYGAMIADRVLAEDIEDFNDCFSTEFDALDIVEVKLRGEQ